MSVDDIEVPQIAYLGPAWTVNYNRRFAWIVGVEQSGQMVLLHRHPGTWSNDPRPVYDQAERLAVELAHVHVFWQLTQPERKPWEGIPLGTRCAVLYRNTKRQEVLAYVYEHLEELGSRRVWTEETSRLPRWLLERCKDGGDEGLQFPGEWEESGDPLRIVAAQRLPRFEIRMEASDVRSYLDWLRGKGCVSDPLNRTLGGAGEEYVARIRSRGLRAWVRERE